MTKTKRYEYKFVLEDLSKLQIEQIVLLHPFSFTPSFQPRWINNVYYDTNDLQSFHQNAHGISRRTKYRIRWYGQDYRKIKEGKLEIKNKDNMLGWKDFIKLNDDFLQTNLNDLTFDNNIILPNLISVVQNRYLRDYYLSADHKFRITIDTNIGHKLPFSNQSFVEEKKIVLELKFDKSHENEAKEVLDFLPFRQKKNSKFGSGIEILY